MTLYQLHLRHFRPLNRIQRSQHFVAIDNRTHGAHTGNHTRTHRSMHTALYIALPFSWQLTLFRRSQAQHQQWQLQQQ